MTRMRVPPSRIAHLMKSQDVALLGRDRAGAAKRHAETDPAAKAGRRRRGSGGDDPTRPE